MMADCANEDEPFDTLSETDSSDETMITKVEHYAICFIAECKESFIRLDKLYEHVLKSHYPIRFQCKQCQMYTDKYHMILRHRIVQHIGKNKYGLYECFYCKRYSSGVIGELVEHLMSCIVVNNDRDGYKMVKIMKDIRDNNENEQENEQVVEKSANQLRVDNKTGLVSYQNKRVSSCYSDQHSQISTKRRLLQSSLLNARLEKQKLYESYNSKLPSNLLAPTGNIHSFLHKANRFSRRANNRKYGK